MSGTHYDFTDWYWRRTIPLLNVLALTNVRFILSVVSLNKGLPFPKTIGFNRSWYSSINPSFVSCSTRVPLPNIIIFSLGRCFNLRIPSFVSSSITSVFCQSAFLSVVENTILGVLFKASANTGLADLPVGVGQKLAIM